MVMFFLTEPVISDENNTRARRQNSKDVQDLNEVRRLSQETPRVESQSEQDDEHGATSHCCVSSQKLS